MQRHNDMNIKFIILTYRRDILKWPETIHLSGSYASILAAFAKIYILVSFNEFNVFVYNLQIRNELATYWLDASDTISIWKG